MNTLTITDLLYEELIMLQDILIMVDKMDFVSNLDPTEREIFDDLYDKVINA